MKRLKRYRRRVAADVRYRVRFWVERGKVTDFVVQLEVRVGKIWQPVIRFDTAHGFPHCDRYRPDGSVRRHERMIQTDLNEAFTHATNTIRNDWERLAKPFLRSRQANEGSD